MTATPAQFFDTNGELRLDGSLVGGGGATAVLVATKVLTNAQVKALAHPTAVEIVAAPGSGFALMPIHATARLTWVADYTNIDSSSNVAIKLGSSSILGQLDETSGGVSQLLADGEDASGIFPPLALTQQSLAEGVSGYVDGDIENKAVSIVADNILAGDFTGGNAGNSLKVTLLYYLVTF